jgi:ariadne-1
MGPWQEHGTSWYNCNRYDEKESLTARDGQSKSRASLERYLHVRSFAPFLVLIQKKKITYWLQCPFLFIPQYYNRWANHELSAKLDQQLYAKTEKKMEEMQLTSDLTWIEVQFAKKAVDVLVLARMTLKWTYAMAF